MYSERSISHGENPRLATVENKVVLNGRSYGIRQLVREDVTRSSSRGNPPRSKGQE